MNAKEKRNEKRAEIFLRTLEWSGSTEIYVPKVGLADGMIRLLYKKETKHK